MKESKTFVKRASPVKWKGNASGAKTEKRLRKERVLTGLKDEVVDGLNKRSLDGGWEQLTLYRSLETFPGEANTRRHSV